MRKFTNNKNKGFTIVELIVVMAIIAILILIAVPTFTKYIDDANETSEMGTADTIYKAAMAATVEEYVATGTYTLGDVSDNIISAVSGDETITVSTYTMATGPSSFPAADSAWDVAIKASVASIDPEKELTVDATGDIYVRAPLADGKRNIYKNGVLQPAS